MVFYYDQESPGRWGGGIGRSSRPSPNRVESVKPNPVVLMMDLNQTKASSRYCSLRALTSQNAEAVK